MKKSDVTCPECHAGYRRVELNTRKGRQGEYRCLFCDHVLEVFDGSTEVAIRLTVRHARRLALSARPGDHRRHRPICGGRDRQSRVLLEQAAQLGWRREAWRHSVTDFCGTLRANPNNCHSHRDADT
jgi:hypothetical protein